MRFAQVLSTVALISLAATGCATKRYGRLQPLTPIEQQAYSCRDIDIEIAKVEGFREQVSDGARINGASVLGFLGDWGIGNATEKNAAERTATQRMSSLLALKAAKGCGGRPMTAPTPDSPAPEPVKQTVSSHVRCETCKAD